jgi:5,10-methylenetetrahydrofolate reductase
MGEADRMLAKTKAGCTFFTTQIIYDAEPALTTLVAYGERCVVSGIAPAPVLLSLAPLTDEADVEFVRWLGAEVPLAVEDAVLAAAEFGGTAGAEASTSRAVQVYEQIRRGVAAKAPRLLLGVNVEQISARHLPLVVPILEAIAQALPAPAHVPSAAD